ncbi:ribonuclease H-like domain-containing protein [Tanacetum coccineum]
MLRYAIVGECFDGKKRNTWTLYNVHSKRRLQGQIDGRAAYAQELFDFIALSMNEFVEQMVNNMQISHVRGKDIGLTFSFPVKQTSVSSGPLIKFNFRRTSLTGFPAQSVGSSNADALDSPYLLVLIIGTSQNRQHDKSESDSYYLYD